ncbi:ABC transporter ATP-binding protein [Paenibacillus zeisoli]|uniref:ABC transporter ATP-binding protein n=1 Tax=Paenibacillus zeisoli TaxID=2496267 RepID=A0A3S1BU22_9BACL|nr:ABC transporter ATP-binding protein [Paenibacillus zeisoli]RUT33383.1 ABC transporter ATP-binding protein [Paenibacillus zeisoli]
MIKIFRFLKPYRIPLIFVIVLVFLQSLSELYLPTLMADIVNHGVVKGDIRYIWRIGLFMLLVAFGGIITSIAASYFSSRVATGFGKTLRSKVFSHVERFSLEEFDKLGTASLITRTTNDITQIQQVLLMMMRMMVSAPLLAIGGIIMAMSKDKTLSLVFVVIIPVLVGAILLIAGRGIPLFKIIQKRIDRLNLVLREGLTGIRVIRSFNRTEHEAKRFEKANFDLTETSIKVNKVMAAMMPTMMLVLNVSSIAIIWYGGIRIDNGSMAVGDLIAFLQYAMQIMFSFIMVSIMFVMVPRASASAVRINEVLDTLPKIKDLEPGQAAGNTGLDSAEDALSKEYGESERVDEQDEYEQYEKSEEYVVPSLKGYVEFDNVSFSYPGAEQPAVEGITFKAMPGEVTAIIGGTGSGKTTLISLIPRFYDVGNGRVLVDGQDVRDLPQEELRAKIGFVPQKAVLFTGSIADNIRYGNEAATDEEVEQAARIAQAEEFISEMEKGYEAAISQGGNNVSGGQKQRLSIARALVRRPEIYIFDDSFSALDFKTDAKLRAALKAETGESTVIIVAQRVSTVKDADRIIVMDESRIAGMGTHRELLESSGVYREIVYSQLSEEEIA